MKIISVLLCTSLAIWTCDAFGIDGCIDCIRRNENCSLCITACRKGIGSYCLKCVTSDINCLEGCTTSCLRGALCIVPSPVEDYRSYLRNNREEESTLRLSYGDYRALNREDTLSVPSVRQLGIDHGHFPLMCTRGC